MKYDDEDNIIKQRAADVMSGAQMKSIRRAMGLTVRDFAATIRYTDIRSLRRMEDDEKPISGPISVILELMRTDNFPWMFVSRVSRPPMTDVGPSEEID